MFTFFKTISCSLAAIALTLTACGPFEHPEERVVITVGPRNIPLKEFKRDSRRVALEIGVTGESEEQELETLIQRVVDYYLIVEYGRQQRITVSDEELAAAIREIKKDYPEQDFEDILTQGHIDYKEWKEALKEQLLIRKITGQVSELVEPVSFQEAKSYYESHKEEFRHQAMVRFRQIVTNTRAEAEDILKGIGKNEEMGQLVEKHGPPGVAGGGEGVWTEKGDLDETMEEVLFSLPIGKISGVIETTYGFHILQVLERKPGGFKTLSEAMKDIESKLFSEKEEAFHKNWLKGLRESTPLTINYELLKGLELG